MSDTIIISKFCILSLYIVTNMSEEEKAKQDVIKSVFYDDEYGYGSKINTLKHAKELDKDSTMDDIDKFMNEVSVRNKKGCSNYNGFLLIFHS